MRGRAHRAVTLAFLMLLAAATLAAMIAYGLSTLDGRSLAALGVVIAAAAIGGIVFSYRRYFPRRR